MLFPFGERKSGIGSFRMEMRCKTPQKRLFFAKAQRTQSLDDYRGAVAAGYFFS
jgi:hypothetical protein